MVFPHCASLNGSSKRLHQWMHTCTGCICLTFLHCAFSNVPSSRLPERMQSHTGCICSTFLHCAFSNVPSKLRRCKVTLVAFVLFFSTMHFQMCLQTTCIIAGIVTLVALVWPHTSFCHSNKNFYIGWRFSFLLLLLLYWHSFVILLVHVSEALIVSNSCLFWIEMKK